MPMVKGAPIYGTEPRPNQTDFGDDNYGYESSYTTGYFGDPGDDDDGDNWIGNPTNVIVGYGPDVFVPDNTQTSTATDTTGTTDTTTGTTDTTTGTTDTTTGTTTDTVVYTPPPIDLGLDIPSTTYSAPVGPPGDLGLGIPAAPTYYEEYVPPQQPMVPQQTQAELLQQIVNQGQGAQGFQDGGLATPVQEPMPPEESKAGIEALKDRIQKQQVRSPLSSGIGSQGDRVKSMYVDSPRDPGDDPRSVSDIVEKQGQQTYMYGYEGDPDTLLTLPQGTSVEGSKGMFITEGSIAGVPWLAEESRAQDLNPDLVDTIVQGPLLRDTNEGRAGTYLHENTHKLLSTTGLPPNDLGVALRAFGLTRKDYGPNPEEFIIAAIGEATGNPVESGYLINNKLDSASEQLKKPGVLETLSLVENLIYRQQGGQRKESHLRDLEDLRERVDVGSLGMIDSLIWRRSPFKALLDETYELGSGT
jgi:hypothetical protein